jgi:hypothetical protein
MGRSWEMTISLIDNIRLQRILCWNMNIYIYIYMYMHIYISCRFLRCPVLDDSTFHIGLSSMILRLSILHIVLCVFQSRINEIDSETVSGCTINNNNQHHRQLSNEKTSVTLSCANHGFILVKNLTFGVHKSTALLATSPTCSYQPGDCTTRTTFIGMECNGLTSCNLDLNPQYLHICK